MDRCRKIALAVWLITCGALTARAADQPIIAADESWPAKHYSSSDPIMDIWIPESVSVLRYLAFINSNEAVSTIGHDETCQMLVSRRAGMFLTNAAKQDPAAIDDFVAEVARLSNHPELPVVPITGEPGHNGQDIDWLYSNWGERVFALCNWYQDSAPYGSMVTVVIRQEKGGPSGVSGSGTSPYVEALNWGWPHGYPMGGLWPVLSAKVINARLPDGWESWDFSQGSPSFKPLPINVDTERRGDPSTIYGEWPRFHTRSRFPGANPSAGIWLIDEDFAWLWRAAQSRHPTKTVMDQDEYNSNGVISNADLSGRPDLLISSPSRPYHPHISGGKAYPLYRIAASITVAVTQCLYDVDSVFVYDGDHLLGSKPSNAYRVYNFSNCVLTRPGYRPLVAIAKLSAGGYVTSRPSMIYVTDHNAVVSTAPNTGATAAVKAAHRPAFRVGGTGLAVRAASGPGPTVWYDLRGRPCRKPPAGLMGAGRLHRK